MPLQIQTTDIVLVRAWCVAGNQAAVNTYGYNCIASSGAGATDADMAAQLDPAYALFYKALLPPNCSYKGLQVYFVKRAGLLPPPANSILGAGVGTTGTTCLPRGIAGIMKFASNKRGPGGRGRVYLPFVAETYQDVTALPTAAYDVLVNSFASNLLTPAVITGGGSVTMAFVLVHRKKGDPVSSIEVTTAQSADKWGQMHKRGEYGRANSSPI